MLEFRIKPALTSVHRPLDSLAVFETASQSNSTTAPTRYAIRQVLDQEYQKYLSRQRTDAWQDRRKSGDGHGFEAGLGAENKDIASTEKEGVNLRLMAVRRDFFGRVVDVALPTTRGRSSQGENGGSQDSKSDEKCNVWVSYHEGFSNAVRKPITLDELMRGF